MCLRSPPPRLSNSLQHAFHVPDRRIGQNAVTQVEDEGPIGETMQDVVDLSVERGTPGKQNHGIEITLNRHGLRDLSASEAAVDWPVETHGLDRHLFDVS